jgi:brefeldin A-resistance guanine nucleotide exchange factor 1
VKRKMTLEQFVRNNRGTNGGKDWPREALEHIFHGIINDEIKLTDDAAPTLTPSRWADMMRACGAGGGKMLTTPEAGAYTCPPFSST